MLPCYNLISDLKEYNLHKKAIKNIHHQLNESIAKIEGAKVDALKKLEEEHRKSMDALEAGFKEQRNLMYSEFQQSLNTYLASSYSGYINIMDVLNGDIESMKAKYDSEQIQKNEILEYARSRNSINEHLNRVLAEIMSDSDLASLVGPFVQRLLRFMEQDSLFVDKQYLSYSEALYIVNGGV